MSLLTSGRHLMPKLPSPLPGNAGAGAYKSTLAFTTAPPAR